MSDDARISRMETDISLMRGDISDVRQSMARLESDLSHLRGEVSDMKTTLAQLMPMIIRIDQKLTDLPSGSEVAELRGRIEEQSKFLQLALASRQPKRPAAE